MQSLSKVLLQSSVSSSIMVSTVFSTKEAFILRRVLQGNIVTFISFKLILVTFRKQEYGLTLLVSTDPEVNKFLENVLSQIKDWLELRKIKKLVVVLNSVETKETLERWEFRIENEVGEDGKVIENAVKDEKKIKGEIRDVIRQITASVTFLPLLDCLCSFDILIYTHRYRS